MSRPQQVIGILLAGGQSRRMGRDKAELVIGRQTQLQRTQELLLDTGCNNVYVSRNDSKNIADIYFNQGPLAGIHAVLSELSSNQKPDLNSDPNSDPKSYPKSYPKSDLSSADNTLALVVPVDMPLLNKESLQGLVRQAQNSGINSYFDDCYLPCVLHIDSNTSAELEQRLQRQQRSVKGYLFDSGATAMPCDNPKTLINTNTLNEWQQACTLRCTLHHAL